MNKKDEKIYHEVTDGVTVLATFDDLDDAENFAEDNETMGQGVYVVSKKRFYKGLGHYDTVVI